jgi:hypothetical protein
MCDNASYWKPVKDVSYRQIVEAASQFGVPSTLLYAHHTQPQPQPCVSRLLMRVQIGSDFQRHVQSWYERWIASDCDVPEGRYAEKRRVMSRAPTQ